MALTRSASISLTTPGQDDCEARDYTGCHVAIARCYITRYIAVRRQCAFVTINVRSTVNRNSRNLNP